VTSWHKNYSTVTYTAVPFYSHVPPKVRTISVSEALSSPSEPVPTVVC
jgi:hypothetical protein